MTIILAFLAVIQAAQTTPANTTAQAAPQPAQTQMAAAAPPTYRTRAVCTRETIPGSNRIQRVCRTVEQAETDRENARLFTERHLGPQVENVVGPGENGTVGGGHNE